MDSIDITDSAFSLGIPGVNMIPGVNTIVNMGSGNSDNTIFFYIGIAIVVAFIAMFVYKFYMNKQKNNEQIDCDGGFCTINNNPQYTTDHIDHD